MSGIRALRREDLPAVCALYERVVRSGSSDPPDGLVGYFERTLLDHPWADEEIPSLVHEAGDGAIVGFIGSHVRRVRLDGRPLRVACGGQLVADPDARQRGVGALLTRHYLAGPQNVTITDGATDYMRRIWTGLGGHTVVGASVGWVKILRPGAAAASRMPPNGHRPAARPLRLMGPALDAAARPVLRRYPGVLPREPEATAEVLTVDGLVQQTRDAARYLRLYPDYDRPYVEWLFAELAAVDVRGVPVRHLVRDSTGRPLGWYVYYLADRGTSQVLQVAAPSGRMSSVLDHLLWHADTHGAAAVRGRVEPPLLGELRPRRCLLVPTDFSLVHTQDPAVLALFGTAQALLSRLDGEWWMGHHVLWPGERGRSGERSATAPS